MPNNEIAKQIIINAGVPISAPSANISGKPSGTTMSDIRNELESKVSAIIDGGESQIGLESTVVKVINEVPYILRPGRITPEDIKNVIGKVEFGKGVFEQVKENEKVESPGVKHKHYAPSTPAIMVYSENDKNLTNYINDIIQEYKGDCVFIGFDEYKNKIEIENNRFISLGSKNDIEQIAKNVYSALRKADKIGSKKIIIQGVKKEGLGIAVMNRLLRSCGYNYIEL